MLHFSLFQLTFENSSPESQSFVTIHCKGAAQPFRIHKNVITHYSPFFSAAFNSDFKEGKTQSMSFEDVEAPIFGFFNNWLYTQKVVNEDGNRLQLIEYAKLWSLSQRFLMPELQAILLRETQDTLPSSDANSGSTLKDFQQYVYLVVDHQEDSDLKKVAIMKTLSSVNQNNIDAVMNSFPEGMLVDFTKALLEDCTQLRGWELGLGLGGVALSMKTENAVAVETPNIGMFGRHRRSR